MASINGKVPAAYDTVAETRNVFSALLNDSKLALPPAIQKQAHSVTIHGHGGQPTIPTPWRETEAMTAMKALEACVVLAIAKARYPQIQAQSASVETDHATLALFMSYLSTINGYNKWDKRSVPHLKPTDIHQAQSNLWRRLSANIYETSRPGEYYHTHGSLEATPILNALGLPGFLSEAWPGMGGRDFSKMRQEGLEDNYDKICELIQERTRKYTVEELERMTVGLKQAGAIVFKEDDFLRTEQGQLLSKEPVISCRKLDDSSPPVEFPPPETSCFSNGNSKPKLLCGVKVLDMTRVIAGPSIGRTLAEYGAAVIKVTSPKLPDVPYYAVDLNFGKRTCDLDLKDPKDREVFEKLLEDADVVVDGYRPGALDRLGYGPTQLQQRFASRGRGFVYVRESCFGNVGPWADRSGWQPIADAVSGLAWGHGEAMRLAQPVLPPFPMSDYGTGALGAVGALLAIYKRMVDGGSYMVDVSLTGWNLWVQRLGQYPPVVWRHMLEEHRPEIEEFKVNHLSNFDIVSKAAIKSMKRLTPRLFEEKYMLEVDAPGFKGTVRTMRPVVQYDSISTGFGPGKESRPNGYDNPVWP